MAIYESQKICDLITDIESEKLVLPAIQRNFVWDEQKVCDLFDSILNDYPIGTFLFWSVTSKQISEYWFNKFIDYYDEQNKEFQSRKRITPDKKNEYIGVLDGQQRITSIYLGIKGYYRVRIKGRWKGKNESYENKYLCINLLSYSEDSMSYFSFKNEDCIAKRINNPQTQKDEFWVRVSEVFESNFDITDYSFFLEEQGFNLLERKPAVKVLISLREALRVREIISFYSAKDKDLSKVVDIFVRVNSGGVKLSASDLMLSIATSSISEDDIHNKMQEAIERIDSAPVKSGDDGFTADKELILTAGLLFTGAASLSLMKKENYSKDRLGIILNNWDKIIDAICCASLFIERIGFKGKKLTSKNLILPVSYYFYKNDLGENYINSPKIRAKKDRIFIRQWLIRAMINSIFRDGIGSTLLRIRKVIDDSQSGYFPLDVFMSDNAPKSLIIDSFDDVLKYKYNDGRVIPILLELSKNDVSKQYDEDHIWPKSKMNTKSRIRKIAPDLSDNELDYYKDNYNYICNLQLLDHITNRDDKRDELFENWIARSNPSNNYYEDNFIPRGISYEFSNFKEFYEERKKLLLTALERSFPSDFYAIVERYSLD